MELLNDKSKERCYFVQWKTNATTLASCEAGLQTGLVRGPKTNKVVTHCPVTTRAEIDPNRQDLKTMPTILL